MPDSPPNQIVRFVARRFHLNAAERAQLKGSTLGQVTAQAMQLIEKRSDPSVVLEGPGYDGGGTLVRADARTQSFFADVGEAALERIDATDPDDLSPKQRRIATRLESLRGAQ